MRYQQGFFSIARTCSTCQGSGKLIVDPCNQCRGQGRITRQRTVTVKVPAGVEEGARMLYSGEGEAGLYGGPSGDLYVVLHAKEHAFFEREGKHLYCAVPISFAQAALGTEITVPTLDGEHILKIPEGTQTGSHIQGEEQRSTGPQRPWARRFARRSQGADAVQADQAATRTVAGAAEHIVGREQACQSLAAEQGEGYFSVERRWLRVVRAFRPASSDSRRSNQVLRSSTSAPDSRTLVWQSQRGPEGSRYPSHI